MCCLCGEKGVPYVEGFQEALDLLNPSDLLDPKKSSQEVAKSSRERFESLPILTDVDLDMFSGGRTRGFFKEVQTGICRPVLRICSRGRTMNKLVKALKEADLLEPPDCDDDFEALAEEVMQNPDARAAALENALRRRFAERLDLERKRRGWDTDTLIARTGLPMRHVWRALHQESGGVLPLLSLVKIADALGLKLLVDATFERKPKKGEPVRGAVYRHYKGGEYTVLEVALHTETGERLVVYKSLGGEVYCRPLKMFMEDVDVAGEKFPRFTKVG